MLHSMSMIRTIRASSIVRRRVERRPRRRRRDQVVEPPASVLREASLGNGRVLTPRPRRSSIAGRNGARGQGRGDDHGAIELAGEGRDEMSDFDAALRGFAALDDEALARLWPWRGREMDVRYGLYRTLEDAQEVEARVSAGPHPESRRILALAQRAFGDLCGLLAGLPADLLDRAPRAGEWPVRETLRHMLLIERRYAVQTRYSLDRKDSEAVRIPEYRQPTATPSGDAGGAGATLVRDRSAAFAQWPVDRLRRHVPVRGARRISLQHLGRRCRRWRASPLYRRAAA